MPVNAGITPYYTYADATKAIAESTLPATTPAESRRVDPPGTARSTTHQPTQPAQPNALGQATSNEHGAAAMRDLLDSTATTSLPDVEEEEIPSVTSSVCDRPKLIFNLRKKKERQQMMNLLPTAVQLKLNQPFGKDDLRHSFTNEATFRHILLPLLFSDFLEDDDWNTLCQGNLAARNLDALLVEYGTVDFRPLQTNFFPDGWKEKDDFDDDRSAMLNACLLFYCGDLASVIRFVGGPFVGAHRNVDKILDEIRPILPEHVFREVERLYREGAPTVCVAESTDENYRAALSYGNHSTADADPELTRKTLLKDEKRGHVAMLDPRFRWHVLRPHTCPVGIVNPNHRIKPPRMFYDASFVPNLWNETVNTWTSTETEPDLEFPSAFHEFIVWLWNMRISYPHEEIYPIDDDITAAFRQICWHPNIASMHGMVILGKLWFWIRLTFGDTSSPPNFEPIPIARKILARYFYDQPDTIQRVEEFIPDLNIILPSAADIESIMRIPADSKNPGVIDPTTGKAQPPPYVHHVDDNLYGALAAKVKQAVAASILALYVLCEFPTVNQPDPFSYEKFENAITHIRKATGTMVDTRSMYLWQPDYKRENTVALLETWVNSKRTNFTVLEGLELLGVLIDASRWYRWGRIHTFILQNVIRKLMQGRYKALVRIKQLTEEKVERNLATRKLHPAVEKRLIIAGCNEIYAKYLYHSKSTTPISQRLRQEIVILYDYLRDFTNPWRINIGHIIDRDNVAVTVGDSSHYGLGFFSDELQVFCMIPTSSKIRHRCTLSNTNPAYLYMNVLEYACAILEYACCVTILEHPSCAEWKQRLYPNGVPPMPNTLSKKDNKSAEKWINIAASASVQAQQLIRIMAEIGKSTEVHQNSEHIPSDDNLAADGLSRPDEANGYRLDHAALVAHLELVLSKYPRLHNYRVFMPSSNLLAALTWALRPKDQLLDNQLTPPPLEQPYGTFLTPEQFRVSIQILY